MIFPTNSVSQFYFLPASGSIEATVAEGGKKIAIKDADGKVQEVTDVIQNILSTKEVAPANDVLVRKGVLIAVKDGKMVKGQDYVLSLRISEFTPMNVTVKAGLAAGVDDSDLVSFYKELAESLLRAIKNDTGKLYELYNAATGTPATDIVAGNKLELGYNKDDKPAVVIADDHETEATFTKGFWLVEAQPDWAIATVPERLEEITLGTNEVLVDAELTSDWLVDTVLQPLSSVTLAKIPNTHKVADLEYFCKFERGAKDGFANWPNGVKPELRVNKDEATGYYILTVHYAYIGAHTSNQRSERDAIFVCTSNTLIASVKTALGIS